MDAVIIYQHSLHLEVRLLAVLLVLEFDKRILQAVLCALVSNDFAGYDWTEAAKNSIQILICEQTSLAIYAQIPEDPWSDLL